jgi:hypothetical protein
MRKALFLPSLLAVSLLACAAARAQMRQTPDQDSRCAEAWARLGPEIRSEGSNTLERVERRYQAAKEFLRVCEGVDAAQVRFVRKWVEKYDAAVNSFKAQQSFRELVEEVRKGDALPATYARLAEVGVVGLYEPNLRQLHALIDSGKSPNLRQLHALIDSGKSLDSKEVREAWAEMAKALDAIVSAYARAIAMCGAREGCQMAKGSWTGNLAKYYALRHNGSTEGLQEFISRGLDAPIPMSFPKP